MQRYGLLAAMAGALALMALAAVWTRSALADAFAEGRRAGAAEIQTAYRLESDRRRALSEAALARASKEAAALEAQRDRLQEKLDDLAQTVERSAHAGDSCLDPDLVRALATIGRRPAGAGARP